VKSLPYIIIIILRVKGLESMFALNFISTINIIIIRLPGINNMTIRLIIIIIKANNINVAFANRGIKCLE